MALVIERFMAKVSVADNGYTPDNTMMDGRNRRCRTCHRLQAARRANTDEGRRYQREWQARKRAQRASA